MEWNVVEGNVMNVMAEGRKRARKDFDVREGNVTAEGTWSWSRRKETWWKGTISGQKGGIECHNRRDCHSRHSNADIQMLTSLETGNGGRECHSVMAEGNVMTLQTRADGGRECHAGREGNASIWKGRERFNLE